MPQSSMKDFLDLSSELTCFTVFELYGTGQASAYLAAVERVVGNELLNQMLAVWRPIVATPDRQAELRRQILGDRKLGPIARNIVKLWYTGTWYELPQEWIEVYGATTANVAFVISPAAYTEGLMWPAFGSHPPGAKAPGYGSWAEAPTFPKF